jgi:hypothetical protein
MSKYGTTLAFGLTTILLLAFGSPYGWADVQTYTLDTPNAALSLLTSQYLNVTVNLTTSTTAAIEFDSLTNGGFIYMTADGQSVDMNVNATSFTVSSITGTNSVSGFNPGGFVGYNQAAAGSVDVFGNFNLRINDDTNNFADAGTSVTFSLTNTSGSWASASDVLTANDLGHQLAAHVYACPEANCRTRSTPTIGFASDTVVPEPRLLLLSGLGLLALVLSSRRRARNLENRNSN